MYKDRIISELKLKLILFLLLTVFGISSSTYSTTIEILPPVINAGINDTVEIEITIDDVDSLYAFSADLYYDQNILNIINISDGDLLCCSDGIDTFLTAIEYSLEVDHLILGISRIGADSTGASTETTTSILRLTGIIRAYGTTELSLQNSFLLKPDGFSEIFHSISNGQIVAEMATANTAVDFWSADTICYTTQRNVSVNLMVSDVYRLFGYSAEIIIPTEYIRLDSVKEGTFLSISGANLTHFDTAYNELTGELLIGNSILSPFDTGVTTMDPSPLATIYYTAIQYGNTSIDLSEMILLAPDGITEIPIDTISNYCVDILPSNRISIQPILGLGKDSYISSLNPSENYGGDTNIVITDNGDKNYGLIEFDIDELGEVAEIGRAQLKIFGGNISNQDTIGVFPISSQWDELSVTWNSFPDTLGIEATSFNGTVDWWEWEITNICQEWVLNNIENNGILLKPITLNGSATTFFSSDYGTDSSLSPFLVLDYYYPPTCPDLLVASESITLNQEIVIQGDTINITARVYNTGLTPSYNVSVRFYNGIPMVGQYQIIDEVTIPYISGYGYWDVETNWNTAELSGSKTIFVSVDPQNIIEECDTLNNKIAKTIFIYGKPDLYSSCDNFVITDNTPIEGDELLINLGVINIGDGPVYEYQANLYLGNPEIDGVLIGEQIVIDTLWSIQSDTLGYSWNTTGYSGNYEFFISLDENNTVYETDETNNKFSCPVSIYRPTLAQVITVQTEASPNDTVLCNISINNQNIISAHNVVLELIMPEELEIINSSILPDTGSDSIWTIDSITSSGGFSLDIEMILSGLAISGDILDISSIVNYTNYNGVQQDSILSVASLDVGEDVTSPQILVNISPSIIDIDTLLIECTPSESLFNNPSVLVLSHSGDTLQLIDSSYTEGIYVYKLYINEFIPDGQCDISLSFEDLSGNTGMANTSFVVDHSPPNITIEVNDTLSLGNHNLELTSSEHLSSIPVITIVDAIGLPVSCEFVGQVGVKYNYVIAIADSIDIGYASMLIYCNDLVANDTSISDSIYIFNAQPDILIDYPSVFAYGNTKITISSNHSICTWPKVTGYDNDSYSLEIIGPIPKQGEYEFWCKVKYGTAEGSAILNISITDCYGNVADTMIEIVIDKSGPILSIESDDSVITSGSTIYLRSDEAIVDSLLELKYFLDETNYALLQFDSSLSDTLFYYTFTLTDTVLWFSASGVDYAGNDSSAFRSFCDFSAQNSQLIFSAIPASDSDVVIGTYVHNNGNTDIDSLSVGFWIDFPIYGDMIGQALYVSIGANDSMYVEVVWPSSQQREDYLVWLKVDYENSFLEINEDNNLGKKGAFGIHAISSKSEYVLGKDSSAVFYCKAYDLSTFDEYADTADIKIVFSIKDTSGNVYVENDTLQYDSTNSYFTKTMNSTFQFNPSIYWAYFQGDIGGGVEIITDSISFIVYDSIIISTSIDKDHYYRGDTVIISGDVGFANGDDYADQDVKIYIKSKGGTRRVDTETDYDGYFTSKFIPVMQEAGSYEVITRVDIGSFAFMDTTDIIIDGLVVSPNPYTLKMSQNMNYTVTLYAKNIGISTLHIDSIYIEGENSDITGIEVSLDFTGTVFDIQSNSQSAFTVEIFASPIAIDSTSYNIIVYFNDSLHEYSSIYIVTDPAQPIIQVSDFNLEFITNPGTPITYSTSLQNDGYTAWRDIEINDISSGLFSLSIQSGIDSLPVGGTFNINITAEPSDTGIFDDTLTITSSNYPDLSIYLRLFSNSDDIGDLGLVIQSDQGDPIDGAKVTLYSQTYDPDSNSYPVFHDITHSYGTCNFLNLPIGIYSYKIKADGYLSKAGQVSVNAGQTLDVAENISLEPQPIEIIWIVEETTVEDVYDITLEITYDTSSYLSPPLLVIKPHVLTHSFALGDSSPILGEFELKNLGEITAENININWPNIASEFSVFIRTPDGQLPDALENGLQPGESVTIPYWIEMGTDVALCQNYGSFFTVTGEYDFLSSHGEVETFGQYKIFNEDCNYDIDFEPDFILVTDVPCWADNSCECDLIDFVNDPIHLSATNIGEGVAYLSPAFAAKFGVIDATIGFSIADLIGLVFPIAGQIVTALEEAASSFTIGFWQPSPYIGPNEVANTEIQFLNPDIIEAGFKLEAGGVLDLVKWEYAAKLYGIPLVIITISDFKLGELLSCIPADINLHFGSGGGGGGGAGWSWSGWSWPSGSGFANITPPEIPESEGAGLIKIVIEQRVSLERQGFTAHLEIINGFENYSIDDIDIDIEVTDANGVLLSQDQYSSDNPLFFNLTDLEGMSDLNGNGSIPAQSSAQADWLIIPKSDAGGTNSDGKQYYLTGNITYKIGGVEYTYTTQSESIIVLPQPKLNLTYFIPQYFQDGVPFTLALHIDNVGAGTANNLRVDSDQPYAIQCAEAVERFEIVGSYIEGEVESSSLLLEFGNLGPGESKAGYWIIEANPGGEIVEFTASWEHDPELGGTSTSLINEVNTYIIMNEGIDIDPEMPTSKDYSDIDAFRGLLVDQNGDFKPDLVYNMLDGNQYNVSMVLPISVDQPTYDNPIMTVNLSNVDGWIYLEINDPFLGTKNIISISREDGSILPDGNYWIDSGVVYICDDPNNNSYYNIQYGNIYKKGDASITNSQIEILPCVGCGDINAGDSLISINFSIVNQGQRTLNSIPIYVYDKSPDYNNIIDSLYIDTLLPNQYKELAIDWLLGDSFDWPLFYHKVYIVIDPNNVVTESDKSNNCAYKGVDFDLLMGDVNHDDLINLFDIIYILHWLYLSGPAPVPLLTSDMECSGNTNILDVVYLINYLYTGGSEPCNHRYPGQKVCSFYSEYFCDISLINERINRNHYSIKMHVDSDADIAGVHQEYKYSNSFIVIDSIRLEQQFIDCINLYSSISDSLIKIGIVDPMGKANIRKGENIVYSIYYHYIKTIKEENVPEVVSSIIVDKNARLMRLNTYSETVDKLIPSTFTLDQNYPNPFNPNTTIRYGLPTASFVELEIINILGRRVKTLVSKTQEAGYHSVIWNGTNNANTEVASGVYFYRMRANGFVAAKKMMIIK